MATHGIRLRPDGKPLTVLWEFSTQFVFTPEFPTLLAGGWNDVGINALVKEITSQALREKGAANTVDIAIEWDEPFEPVLIIQCLAHGGAVLGLHAVDGGTVEGLAQ